MCHFIVAEEKLDTSDYSEVVRGDSKRATMTVFR